MATGDVVHHPTELGPRIGRPVSTMRRHLRPRQSLRNPIGIRVRIVGLRVPARLLVDERVQAPPLGAPTPSSEEIPCVRPRVQGRDTPAVPRPQIPVGVPTQDRPRHPGPRLAAEHPPQGPHLMAGSHGVPVGLPDGLVEVGTGVGLLTTRRCCLCRGCGYGNSNHAEYQRTDNESPTLLGDVRPREKGALRKAYVTLNQRVRSTS